MAELTIREASEDDLPFLVKLIDDDPISSARDPARMVTTAQQTEGFKAIASDPNHLLLIAELEGEPVGSFQLSFIPGVSRQGAWRGQIESVRIAQSLRNQGYGEQMMQWAIERCRKRGCGLVQLTSDKSRDAAHRFYERLGFSPSHTGFKLKLR